MCAQQPDLVLSGGYDHKVAVWDVRDPEKPSMAMEHGAPVEAVLVLPGGGLVASVGGENNLPKTVDFSSQKHHDDCSCHCDRQVGSRVKCFWVWWIHRYCFYLNQIQTQISQYYTVFR